MALSLETISARIGALEEAIASGQLQVGYEDKTVRYRDLSEMFSVLQWLKNKQSELEGGRAAPRQIRMVTGDGYGPRK